MQYRTCTERRDSGIEFLDQIPWGTHMCGFYEREQDHADLVTSFFEAGAAADEYCLWITDSLKPALQGVAAKYNVEVFSYREWYCFDESPRPESILKKWRRKISEVLEQGYAGLRLVHSRSSLFPADRAFNLMQEALLDKLLNGTQALALCPYPLHECGLTDILDLSTSHSFTFFRGAAVNGDALKNINRYNLLRSATAEVVHEIRNPITAIRAFMELFHSKPEFGAYSDLIGKVIAEVDRADQLACQFLSLAKTQTPNYEQGCNMITVIEAVQPLLEAIALKKKQVVQFCLDEVPDISCHPGELRQVILNLAHNAFDAMSQGGVLTLITENRYPDVILRVKDTGCGIPQEYIDKLSLPFFTTKNQGTGLGLPVTFRITEKYNGTVSIESSTQGTTVTISFPAVISQNGSKGPQ